MVMKYSPCKIVVELSKLKRTLLAWNFSEQLLFRKLRDYCFFYCCAKPLIKKLRCLIPIPNSRGKRKGRLNSNFGKIYHPSQSITIHPNLWFSLNKRSPSIQWVLQFYWGNNKKLASSVGSSDNIIPHESM